MWETRLGFKLMLLLLAKKNKHSKRGFIPMPTKDSFSNYLNNSLEVWTEMVLIRSSVTLPSSAVYRSDSSGPQMASSCSADLLSTCSPHSAALMGWYYGPWSQRISKWVKDKEVWQRRYDGYVSYQVIVGMFPAVTPLLSIVDLQQQTIGHVHVLRGPFLSAQIIQH